MKRLGLLRFIPLWPFLITGILLLIWSQRLEIAAWILDRVVIVDDIQDLEISPQQLDLNHSQLSSISFSAPIGNQLYRFEAMGLTLTHTIRGLTSFSVDSVIVDKLTINQLGSIPGKKKSDPEALDPSQLVTFFSQIFELQLPVRSVLFQDVDLLVPEYDFSIESGSAEVFSSDHRVDLRIVDRQLSVTASLAPSELKLSLNSTDMRDRQPLNLKFTTTAPTQKVEIVADLDTQSLGQWMENYPVAASLSERLKMIKARPDIGINIISRDQELSAEINARSDQIVFGELSVTDLSLQGRYLLNDELFSGSVRRLEFGSSTNLSASTFEVGDMRARDLSFLPIGSLDVFNGDFFASLEPGSRLTASYLELPEYSASAIDLEPDITVTSARLEIGDKLRAKAERINGEEFSLNHPELIAQKPSRILIDTKDGFVHKDALWRLDTEIGFDASSQVSGVFDIAISHLSETQLESSITSSQPQFSLDFPLPMINTISAEILRNGDLIEVTGNTEADNVSTPLDFSLTHNLQSASGDAQLWSQSLLSAPELVNLAQVLEMELPDELSIDGGTCDIDLFSRWQGEQFSLNTQFDIRGLSGIYLESKFRNMQIQGSLELLPVVRSEEKLSATIETLEYGVVLERLASDFDLELSQNGDLPLLTFDSIRGELFGSEFITSDFVLDLNMPDAKLDLKVRNLDIEQVVATQGIEGLEATGQVDGILPITVSSDGISIEDGVFWNHLGGGNIVYSISDEQAAALDNPLTDVVITALRDFRYRVLTAKANYHPNGDLYMDFHLEGISPQLDPNRPVHLNINSEQNVLSLLKSLSYSEGVSKALDKQIQEKFE